MDTYREKLEAELEQKLADGVITVDEAEQEWQDYMHRTDTWAEW